ncbi:hypothetical protein BX600DRAFT_429171 [Xylariales sp. PMI_506]|nr:hypothetical protein BX600DRAFT_429171 [Xylariales sp. PMI_506]
MKFTTIQSTAIGSAVLLWAAQPCLATISHRHHHLSKKNDHSHLHNSSAKEARSASTCTFPTDQGLVAVTPGSSNGGWALSPDQECTADSYCPYACPSGQVMAQWEDGSTYATTERMNGGIYCGKDAEWSKPFPSQPLCVDGTGTVTAVNDIGKVVSFCQTVLPGNEDILIPNDVSSSLVLAVPSSSYWQSTAAHYYVNPPGVDADEGCHWGTSAAAWGNWAPYVAGANTDASGLTYVKVGTNPIWLASDLSSTKPTYGLKIECTSGNCVGLPCAVEGSDVTSSDASVGAGDAAFCVATIPKGGSANIVVYSLDGSTDSSSSTTSTTSSAPSPSTTTTSEKSSIATFSSTLIYPSSSAAVSTSASSPEATESSSPSYDLGGVFQQNTTSTETAASPASASTTASGSTTSSSTDSSSQGSASSTDSTKNDASGSTQSNGAIASLIIALVAAACIL